MHKERDCLIGIKRSLPNTMAKNVASLSHLNFKFTFVILRELRAWLRLAPQGIIAVFPAMSVRQDDALFDAQYGFAIRRGAPVLAEGAARFDFRIKKLIFCHT